MNEKNLNENNINEPNNNEPENNETNQKGNGKKRILISLIVVFGVILICTGGYLAIKQMGIFNAGETTRHVQESYAPELVAGTTAPEGYDMTIPPTANTEPPSQPAAYATESPTAPKPSPNQNQNESMNNPVDFAGLMAMNSEVYSWIYIPDTAISLPVCQSTVDDNFYLDHDVYKDYSFPGTIYSQSKNKTDYSDRVTVLYGHNMANGSMFADLHLFSDEDFFNSHPYIYIYTKDRKLTYQVISAHTYDSRHILNSYDFSKDDVFKSWLENAQNPRAYYSNTRQVNLDLNSKILVLSTCTNSGDGRYLVQGVLIQDEKTA